MKHDFNISSVKPERVVERSRVQNVMRVIYKSVEYLEQLGSVWLEMSLSGIILLPGTEGACRIDNYTVPGSNLLWAKHFHSKLSTASDYSFNLVNVVISYRMPILMSYSWYNYKPKPSSHTIYCGGVKRYYVNPSKLPSLSETDINPQTKKEKKFHYLIYPTTCKRAHRKISLGFPNDSLSRSDQITRSFFLFWVPYVCPTFTRPVTLVTNTSVEWLLLCSYCVKYIRTELN